MRFGLGRFVPLCLRSRSYEATHHTHRRNLLESTSESLAHLSRRLQVLL